MDIASQYSYVPEPITVKTIDGEAPLRPARPPYKAVAKSLNPQTKDDAFANTIKEIHIDKGEVVEAVNDISTGSLLNANQYLNIAELQYYNQSDLINSVLSKVPMDLSGLATINNLVFPQVEIYHRIKTDAMSFAQSGLSGVVGSFGIPMPQIPDVSTVRNAATAAASQAMTSAVSGMLGLTAKVNVLSYVEGLQGAFSRAIPTVSTEVSKVADQVSLNGMTTMSALTSTLESQITSNLKNSRNNIESMVKQL